MSAISDSCRSPSVRISESSRLSRDCQIVRKYVYPRKKPVAPLARQVAVLGNCSLRRLKRLLLVLYLLHPCSRRQLLHALLYLLHPCSRPHRVPETPQPGDNAVFHARRMKTPCYGASPLGEPQLRCRYLARPPPKVRSCLRQLRSQPSWFQCCEDQIDGPLVATGPENPPIVPARRNSLRRPLCRHRPE